MSDYNNIRVRIVETVEREATYSRGDFAAMLGLTPERVLELNYTALGGLAARSEGFWESLDGNAYEVDSDLQRIEAFVE